MKVNKTNIRKEYLIIIVVFVSVFIIIVGILPFFIEETIEYDLGFTTVENGFNPEMGFANRNNYQLLIIGSVFRILYLSAFYERLKYVW